MNDGGTEKNNIKEPDRSGEITVPDEKTLAQAAVHAVLSVPGISSMSATLGDALRSTIKSVNPETRGVKISGNYPETSLDIYLNVLYGTQIPEAAWEVQTAVKDAFLESFGFSPAEINIHVEGVEMRE